MNLTIKNSLIKIISQVSSPELGKIKKFYNVHSGESCYIFGDGISLKSMDINCFLDKQAIVCNYFIFHKDFNRLNCSYLVNCAPFYFAPVGGYSGSKKKHMSAMSSLYEGLMETYLDKYFFLHLSNYPFLSGDNICYMFRDIDDDRFSINNISKRLNCFEGVIRTAILLAIYLGFDHIYLLGFDYTHIPSRSLHWYEKGEGVLCEQPDYNKEFLTVAKEFIDITTITLDGISETVSAVTYEEFTGHNPIKRENTELVDDRYLKVLSTWPGYSIY